MTKQEKMERFAHAAYALWRFDMWVSGHGNYGDIEWASRWGLLRPYKKPSRIRSRFVKWVMRIRHRNDEE